MSNRDDLAERILAIFGGGNAGSRNEWAASMLANLATSDRLTLARALRPDGWVVVRWPPTGDDVQACADELNPFAETAWQYGLSVETVCEVIDMWMRRAAMLASSETPNDE